MIVLIFGNGGLRQDNATDKLRMTCMRELIHLGLSDSPALRSAQ
jgi:hypothetical protein